MAEEIKPTLPLAPSLPVDPPPDDNRRQLLKKKQAKKINSHLKMEMKQQLDNIMGYLMNLFVQAQFNNSKGATS